MRELKRLVFLAVGLSFLVGGGLGVVAGSLAAAPPERLPGVERRVEDFRRHYGLDESQARRVRDMLLRHDFEVEEIRRRITSEQAREIEAVHQRYQKAILEIVDPSRR